MRRVALHRFDDVRDEVQPLLQLDVDIGKRLSDPLPHRDELVVDHDDPKNENDDDAEYDPAGGGHWFGS